MSMAKSLSVMVLLVCCGSTLGACKMLEQLKKTGEAATKAAASATGPAAPTAQEDKDSQLSEKLEGYISCMNYETRAVYRNRAAYLRTVDPVKGPTGKESYISAQSLSPESCLKRIDEAKAKAPSLPELETAATDYKTALDALNKISKTAHDYYDQKDYKDDKYAKGMEMHKPLMAAYDAFEKADKVFDEKVTSLNEGISQRRLVRLKDDPKAQLEYSIAKTVDDAKKLVHFTEVDSWEKLDEAGFASAFAAYEKSYNDLNTYVSGHAPEAEKVSMLSSFTSATAAYLKAGKELMRRKRDKKDFKGEHGSPENIDGHPAQVLAKYNDMINASNNLRFRQ
jgi:hypothetical protein